MNISLSHPSKSLLVAGLNHKILVFLLVFATLNLSTNSMHISRSKRSLRSDLLAVGSSGNGLIHLITKNSNKGRLSSPESQLITHLNEESNEISDEKLESSSGAKRDSKGKKSTSHQSFHLPAYLEHLDEQFNKAEVGGESGPEKGPIARAWLPTEIRRIETLEKRRSTSIIFQQTQSRETLGDFHRAELILSMKEDAQLKEDGDAFVRLLANADSEAKTLSKRIRFYAFNVTEFLLKNLAFGSLEHPHHIELNLEMFNYDESTQAGVSSVFLDQLFDVQVERPFIVFFYKEMSLPAELTRETSSRKKRSPPTALAADAKTAIIHKNSYETHTLSDKSLNYAKQPVEELETSGSNATQKNHSMNMTMLTMNHTLFNSSLFAPTAIKSLIPPGPPPPTPTPRKSISDLLNLCRKVEWSVNVDDIDWPEVISHKKIDLGYCAGECPFPLENDHYNFTLHSYFVDKFKRKKHFDIPSNFPTKSCCIPVKYKPIRVWQEEEENILVRVEFADVLVDTCGCR